MPANVNDIDQTTEESNADTDEINNDSLYCAHTACLHSAIFLIYGLIILQGMAIPVQRIMMTIIIIGCI